MDQGTSVFTEQRGYRRGLILGFTMAESMLLLVFCLLLAAGAIIMKAQDDLKTAETAKTELQLALNKKEAELGLLDEQLKLVSLSANPTAETEQAWRELSKTRLAVNEMAKHKLTLQEVVNNAEVVSQFLESEMTPEAWKQVQDLITELEAKGVTTEQIKEILDSAEKRKELNLTDEQIAKLDPALDLVKETLLSSDEMTSKQILEELIAEAAIGRDIERKEEIAKQDASEETKDHKWPPIISLSEANQYSFKSGSAELSPNFRQALEQKVAKQIAATAKQYGVDVIEVIGHTDEQGMGKRQSNMDYDMKAVLDGTASVATLQPGDNAGLGMARAVAVTEALKAHPDLAGMTVLPMSGAQLILPNDSLTNGAQLGDASNRRRIEIRVRKRNENMPVLDIETGEPEPLTVNAPAPALPPPSRTVRSMEVFSPEQQLMPLLNGVAEGGSFN